MNHVPWSTIREVRLPGFWCSRAIGFQAARLRPIPGADQGQGRARRRVCLLIIPIRIRTQCRHYMTGSGPWPNHLQGFWESLRKMGPGMSKMD